VFILYGVLAGVLLGLLLGGDLRRLSAVTFHWWPVILAGLLAQVILFSAPVTERIGDLGPPLYVASTLIVLVAVLRNARVPGLAVVFVGGLSNLAAIVANGGYMPASAEAMASLGKSAPEVYSNSAVLEAPALQPLTDIFALPRWLPFANVFSIGDVLIAIGVTWAIVALMRAPVAPKQLTLVMASDRTDEPLAPWDSRRSVPLEEHPFFRWNSVQGKPVARRGTQS
jgi:hypothetical protein